MFSRPNIVYLAYIATASPAPSTKYFVLGGDAKIKLQNSAKYVIGDKK